MENDFIATAEVMIHAQPRRVWDALLDPQMTKEYLFGTEVETDWQEGSEIFYRGEWEGKLYEDKGRIVRVEPEKELITTFWSELSGLPDEPEHYKTITYHLERAENGTRVTLSQDHNASVEEAAHSTENWKLVLGKLKELLESGDSD